MFGIEAAVGAGLGAATAKWEDRRQVELQKKLQALQIEGSKEMGKYNQQLAMDMWEKTNFEAQRKQLEKAGLNAGLMYQKGGAGGTTATPTGTVSGATAAGSKGEIGMGMQLGLQKEMMEAQINLANSQATKNKVEAAKTAGIDTEKTTQEVENLKILGQKTNAELWNIAADTANKEEQNIILQQEKQMKQIQAEIANMTIKEATEAARASYNTTISKLEEQQAKSKVAKETADKQIEAVTNATIKQLAEINAIKEGTEFNYGSDAEKVRWLAAATGALRGVYTPPIEHIK